MIKKLFKLGGNTVRDAATGFVEGVQTDEGKKRRALRARQRALNNRVDEKANTIRYYSWILFISLESFLTIYTVLSNDMRGDWLGDYFTMYWPQWSIPLLVHICILVASNAVAKHITK